MFPFQIIAVVVVVGLAAIGVLYFVRALRIWPYPLGSFIKPQAVQSQIVQISNFLYVDTTKKYSFNRKRVHSTVLARLDKQGWGESPVYLCGLSPELIYKPDFHTGQFEVIPVPAYERALVDPKFNSRLYYWSYDPYDLVPVPACLGISIV